VPVESVSQQTDTGTPLFLDQIGFMASNSSKKQEI